MSCAHLCELFGGLAMFLYGMETASNGLRRASGVKTRDMLQRLTRRRFLGLIGGVVLSFGMQSSTAATVMLVGLADAGLITLMQALPVALGSAVGTTLTVQVIAFDLGGGALILLVAGLAIRWVCRYDRHKRVGDALFGLGLIFYGMTVMGHGAKPLAQVAWFQGLLSSVAGSPILGVLVSAVLTGVIQSSAATIAVVMSILAARVGVDLSAHEALRIAVPLILGANIGTCLTALLASLAASRIGKQVALGNLLFKVGGVLLCLPFLAYFAEFAWWVTSLMMKTSPAAPGRSVEVATRAIANAHTLFNVLAALVFLPFVGVFHALVARLASDRPTTTHVGRSLVPRLLDMPEVAVEAIAGVVRDAALQVRAMYALARRAVIEKSRAAVDQVRRDDDKIDDILVEVTRFAIALSEKDLDTDIARRRDALLITLRDLEQIGDVLSKVMVKMARKSIERGMEFSDAGREELDALFQEVADSFDNSIRVMARQKEEDARKVLDFDSRFEQHRRDLFALHLERLGQGNPHTAGTLETHMDVVTSLRQIHGLLADIASVMTQRTGHDGLGHSSDVE